MSKKEKALPKGEKCKFCKHEYIFPCHGKRYDCANAVYIRSNKKVNPYAMTLEQLAEVKATKELPNVKEVASKQTKVKSKRKRVRL